MKDKMYMVPIVIWEPRYHDMIDNGAAALLIDPKKLRDGKNLILVTLGYLAGTVYEVDSVAARACPLESNGTISCLVVPVTKCEVVTNRYSVERWDNTPVKGKDGYVVLKDKAQGYSWRVLVDADALSAFTLQKSSGAAKKRKPKAAKVTDDIPVDMSDEELEAIMRESMESLLTAEVI